MEPKANQIAEHDPNPSKRQMVISISASTLILLWSYTAISKLMDLEQFQSQLDSQVFGEQVAYIMLWAIPLSELTAAALLLFRRTTRAGFIFSIILMFLFTGYIALVLMGYYNKVPCSCGGVLRTMGWKTHLWFNLFFLTTATIGLLADSKTTKKPVP